MNAIVIAIGRCVAGSGRRHVTGLGLVLAMALAGGCATDEQLSGPPFDARAAKYPAIPAGDHARLQRGEVQAGDTPEMVWVARGDPGRKSSQPVAGQTNDVWSYFQTFHTTTPAAPGYSNWRPEVMAGGQIVWVRKPVPMAEESARTIEVLRVQFHSNRVVAVEVPDAPNKAQP